MQLFHYFNPEFLFLETGFYVAQAALVKLLIFLPLYPTKIPRMYHHTYYVQSQGLNPGL